jgi:serine protease Do
MSTGNIRTSAVAGASAISTIADALQSSVVAVQDGERGGGAGVIWRADGLILTNDHVAAHEQAEVVFQDGERATAQVVARDPVNDLAALQVARSGLAAAPVGDARALRVGELVVAIGHPLGVERAVSAGIVNARPNPRAERELIVADIYLNRGNSGGPLANARGEVIGINAMVMTPGLGLAVPSHVVQDFVRSALGAQRFIGVTVQPVELPEALRQATRTTADLALIVTGLEADSPAERAGLLPGDLLVGINGRALDDPRRLLEAIALSDGMLALTLIRGGTRLELITPVEERVREAA